MPKAKSTDTTHTASGTEDVAALRAELDAMTGRASTAETLLAGERTARKKAEMATMSADERSLVSAQEANEATINSLESELQGIEDQIAALADEPGHGRDIAKLNRSMASATAKLQTEEQRKAYLEGQRDQFKARREAAPTEDPNDKVLANGSKLSAYGPKTQAWLQAHPKVFEDSRYLGRAIAAAMEATGAEGIADQSAEYFQFIESRLGEGPASTHQDDEEDEIDEDGEEIAAEPVKESYVAEKPQSRAAGQGSIAPVIRQAATSTGSTPRRAPALSAEEKEVALGLYSHLQISDADKLVRYAEGKRMMKSRNTGHFASN